MRHNLSPGGVLSDKMAKVTNLAIVPYAINTARWGIPEKSFKMQLDNTNQIVVTLFSLISWPKRISCHFPSNINKLASLEATLLR